MVPQHEPPWAYRLAGCSNVVLPNHVVVLWVVDLILIRTRSKEVIRKKDNCPTFGFESVGANNLTKSSFQCKRCLHLHVIIRKF